MTPFNKPYLTGKELQYMEEAVKTGKISGDGIFSRKCQRFFEERYGFQKTLLTTSCTDALEMAALLLNIREGDEVILPSYTFVSSANAFVLRGAKVVFCDSRPDHPGMDESKLEELITDRTKVIIVVHYAGISCEMKTIMGLAKKYGIAIVEDAAQAIDNYYIADSGSRVPLGSIGELSAFSFHETKNIISGEGGLLVVNDSRYNERAEIIREKGTDRSKFFRGEVDKYGWVDIGSSFLPSELIAAFLFAQLESIDRIQQRRKLIWETYWHGLKDLAETGLIALPFIPSYSTNNAHIFYIICISEELRDTIINTLKSEGVLSVFHYQSLHRSPYYLKHACEIELPLSDLYSARLLRLPLFYELELEEVERICGIILNTVNQFKNQDIHLVRK